MLVCPTLPIHSTSSACEIIVSRLAKKLLIKSYEIITTCQFHQQFTSSFLQDQIQNAQKGQSSQQCLFALWGPMRIKASRKILMKITLRLKKIHLEHPLLSLAILTYSLNGVRPLRDGFPLEKYRIFMYSIKRAFSAILHQTVKQKYWRFFDRSQDVSFSGTLTALRGKMNQKIVLKL